MVCWLEHAVSTLGLNVWRPPDIDVVLSSSSPMFTHFSMYFHHPLIEITAHDLNICWKFSKVHLSLVLEWDQFNMAGSLPIVLCLLFCNVTIIFFFFSSSPWINDLFGELINRVRKWADTVWGYIIYCHKVECLISDRIINFQEDTSPKWTLQPNEPWARSIKPHLGL